VTASNYSIQPLKASAEMLRLPFANETPPTHNNRSRDAGGVWAEYVYS